ncbi:MAG: oligosaccharide flippase family protein [Desulfovibrio sp.]|nr:oligosaccharide flippase family protein [Desulfovibrio sp.]
MPATLARRYIFKLGANLASVPVYLAMEAILPRALGPQAYGNFSFSTSVFQQFSGFLDMGTSTCFYNALSRNQTSAALLAFYLRIALLVAAITMCAGFLALWPPAAALLLPDVPIWYAPLAALWALLTWWGRVLRSANDALGATIHSEIWRAALSLIGTGLLAALYLAGWLDIKTLFLQQYLLLGATALAFWLVAKKHWAASGIALHWRLRSRQKKIFTAQFFRYSHPLLVQALLSFIMLTAERWLLQWFDGSSQQGFYALSQKVSMACFLFVSAMTPLLMREFSIAWGRKDAAAIGSLLTRFAPALYALAAYFSCFTVAEGRTMVWIFGGDKFLAATLPVQIMALYPLHQAYGQMASSVFHATGKTGILRNLTACECVYGLAAAWALLAPPELWGLNLGATGLAIKTVSVQFLSVNICLWLASRFVPFAFWKNLGQQILVVAFLLFLAYASREVSQELAFLEGRFLARFIVSGFLYSAAVVSVAIIAPRLFGVSRADAKELIRRVRRHFRK